MAMKCWRDRPTWVGSADYLKRAIKKKPVTTSLMVLLAVFFYLLYWVTLPFAAINEWVREA